MRMSLITGMTLAGLMALPAGADVPVINSASAERVNGLWNFSVTIDHEDRGWDDYVTGWRVLDTAGQEIGKRDLHMPHEGPRARTRSLSGVEIEPNADFVEIEVRDSKLGWTGAKYRVALK